LGKKDKYCKYGTDHVDNLSLILDKVYIYMQHVTKYVNSELQSQFLVYSKKKSLIR